MKPVGIALTVLGAVYLMSAIVDAPKAENISYLVGTMMPGLVLLIIGLSLGRANATSNDVDDRFMSGRGPSPLARAHQRRVEGFKRHAIFGIAIGIPLMFLSGRLTTNVGPLLAPMGAICGFGLVIWGCVNYVRWKGYSGWFGLFGYLMLLGLLILVILPNRRQAAKRARRTEMSEDLDDFDERDHRPSYPFLLALAPLGIVGVIVCSLIYSIGSDIDPAELQEVVQRDVGFQAWMPGAPRLVKDIKETPAGDIELHKFIVEPKGKNEGFMVVSIRFPDEVAKEMGGVEKILDLGRQDFVAAINGQIKSEKQIDLQGHPGLELEALRPRAP
jgi:MFS family permease